MNILNLFKVSLRAVANNKMRSFLSMLGIIIGVAAVIIMMSIGQGSKESIRAELSYAWRCTSGPVEHADIEDGRLRAYRP